MIENVYKTKGTILKKIIETGINISPSVLDLILETDNPSDIIDRILKEISFIPTFKSHLTIESLQDISNKEILKKLKIEVLEPKSQQTDLISTSDAEVKLENNTITPNKNILNKRNQQGLSKNKIEHSSNNSAQRADFNHQGPNKDRLNLSIGALHKSDESKYRTTKNKVIGSKLRFKAIAKNYDLDYTIKKDPTGKLFTSGEYEDFYNLTINKFDRLQKLMRKRPGTQSSINISNIKKLDQNTEVSTIGLVSEIRKTKNDNFFIVLEDLTGFINVLIKGNTENQDLIKFTERIINDQMLFVRGMYNPGKNGREGIIFGNSISKIDIPMGFTPVTSPDPLSIALISDTHIGSKEFEFKLWERFINFLNGNIDNKKLRDFGGQIKYIIINGDLVDGIGVYPTQEGDLNISDIYEQYKRASELLSEIPDHIKIFYSCGNHEPIRNAIPRPAVPKKYCQELLDLGVELLGNPCMIQTHKVNTLVYHGDSLLDMNLSIPGLSNDKPAQTMKELLICRHLAPIFGSKTQIAPIEQDWLVIDEIPHIFHTGHLHINGFDIHRGVRLVNSGCFQSQTDFMRSFGIRPTPGIVPIIQLDSLEYFPIDLRKYN